MYLKRAQGFVRLRRRYSCEQLDMAAEFLMSTKSSFPKIKELENLVKNNGLDSYLSGQNVTVTRKTNPNLRDQGYWQNQQQ
jgi:hypothetical protein